MKYRAVLLSRLKASIRYTANGKSSKRKTCCFVVKKKRRASVKWFYAKHEITRRFAGSVDRK